MSINDTRQTFLVPVTKQGFPAMWESGGSATNTGRATIIAGRTGEPPRAVYVKRGGQLACGEHALITVHPGFYIVDAKHRRGEFTITILRIVIAPKRAEGQQSAEVVTERVNAFTNGEWDGPLDRRLETAINAAKRKAETFHCRIPVYIDTSDKPETPRLELEQVERPNPREQRDTAPKERKASNVGSSFEERRNVFRPRFEELHLRVIALGRTIEFANNGVSLSSEPAQYVYSDGGLALFTARVTKFEQEGAAAAKAKVEAAAPKIVAKVTKPATETPRPAQPPKPPAKSERAVRSTPQVPPEDLQALANHFKNTH